MTNDDMSKAVERAIIVQLTEEEKAAVYALFKKYHTDNKRDVTGIANYIEQFKELDYAAWSEVCDLNLGEGDE